MTAAARLDEARRLHRAGETQAALQAYQAALDAGAASPEVRLAMADLHSGLAEHALAAAHLEALLASDPRNADALCMLGTVMSDLGRHTEAATLLREALAVRPAFPEAHFNLGLALFETGILDEALGQFAQCLVLRRGAPWQGAWPPPPGPRLSGEDALVNWVKIKHDCEQLEYLLRLERLPAEYFPVLEEYRTLLQSLREAGDGVDLRPLDTDRFPLVAATYKRPLYVATSEVVDGPIVRPDLDWRAIERRYLDGSPSVVTVDGLLTPSGLSALRRFCRESFVWNDVRAGYLGAYFFDGFASGALLALAAELRARMPEVIGDHPLQMMWGYKYESELAGAGIRLHADAAAVNVNLWLTEDEANLEPEGGGLLIHSQDAPPDWGFAKFNRDVATIEQALREAGAPPIRVPYRANRAAIFDSDLFHATDSPRFRHGYMNRRINVTLLFGLRA